MTALGLILAGGLVAFLVFSVWAGKEQRTLDEWKQRDL